MKRQYYFYVLKDPILKEIRYFGRTINPIKRLKDHVYESKNCDTHKCNWIKSLPNDPILEVVYKELCTIEESKQIEKSILRKLMRRFNLTNSWDNCLGAHKTGKLVHQYDLQGNFIKTYQNSNHASTEVNISDSNILRACKKASKLEAEIENWCQLSGFDPYSKEYKEIKIDNLKLPGLDEEKPIDIDGKDYLK